MVVYNFYELFSIRFELAIPVNTLIKDTQYTMKIEATSDDYEITETMDLRVFSKYAMHAIPYVYRFLGSIGSFIGSFMGSFFGGCTPSRSRKVPTNCFGDFSFHVGLLYPVSTL